MSERAATIEAARARMAGYMVARFPDTCSISIPGGATNAGNGTWSEPSSSINNVPCKYEPLSADERVAPGSAVEGFAGYKLTLPVVWNGAALIVPAKAAVIVAARGIYPARTFTVTGPLYSDASSKLTVAVKLEN